MKATIETVDKLGQLNVAKQEVEKLIQKSKMIYTIRHPIVFMEVWLGPHLGFDAVNSTATIYGPGTNKLSWIATKDVAAFAVASLENDSARNSIIDIGVPRPFRHVRW